MGGGTCRPSAKAPVKSALRGIVRLRLNFPQPPVQKSSFAVIGNQLERSLVALRCLGV